MGNWNAKLNILIVITTIILIICFLSCDDSLNRTIQYFRKEEKKEEKEEKKENFMDWTMHNVPIINGFYPRRDRLLRYNPLYYNNRTVGYFNQHLFPNMRMPSSIIGCGGRRMPCLGGSQEIIPVVHPGLDISETNIAPLNILSRPYDNNLVGQIQQVGVLFKVFGESNDVSPLFGVKRYRNSDTWDYFTRIGKEGNRVRMRVITKNRNNNELQTNDEVVLEGDTTKYRVVIYDNNFSRYVPYFR